MPWPEDDVVIPGRFVTIKWSTASDYAEDAASNKWGFKLNVAGKRAVASSALFIANLNSQATRSSPCPPTH